MVHNRYRSETPSGENVVVDTEMAALAAAGVAVVPYLRSSDEIPALPPLQRVTLPLRGIRSPWDVRAVRELIVRERPDVMHLHNPNPLISLSVVGVAHDLGIPVVQTVHNHRHTCIKGTYLRDGAECKDCLGHRYPGPAVLHGCYRGSRLQSAAAGAALAAHRGSYRAIDRFLALTPEIAASLVESGMDPGSITVKPNSVPDPGPPDRPGKGFVFVGRLTEEKGVRLLAQAWERVPVGALGTLTVVGDGPQRGIMEDLAARRSDILVTGRLAREAVQDAIREAGALVLASVCAEAFPMVTLEAMALGRPIVSTDLGGLPGIVTPDLGWVVRPDPESLAGALTSAAAEDLAVRGRAARARYEQVYHPGRVIADLIAVYEQVVAEHAGGRPPARVPL